MASSETCTSVDVTIERTYLPVMYGLISIVGSVGNVIVILTYLVKLRPWRSSSVIIVNLSIADLFYALSLPFLVHFYTTGDWRLGENMCRLMRFCFHFNLYGSILFLTCLSVFRYVVVSSPLRAAQIQRKVWGILACLAVWTITMVEIGPMLYMIVSETAGNTTSCLDFASNEPERDIWLYGWLLTGFGFLVPLAVVSWSYCSIARMLARGPNVMPHRVRARRLSVLVLAVFVICFLPYHALRVLRVHSLGEGRNVSCSAKAAINAAYIVSRPLAGLNTIFDLVLFTLAGDQFQQALFSLFHRRNRSSTSVAVIHTITR